MEAAPTHLARAPGRVNLLGEHIDYHDLPVLPMALERGVRIAFTPRTDGIVRLTNRDPAFEPLRVVIEPAPPPGPPGHWGNYVRAAVATVASLAEEGAFGGFDGILDADLPPAAGLSSSSALVVATALAILATRSDPQWTAPRPTALAALLAKGERYVGTAGGGMDQAASLGGRDGHLLRISFDPVRWVRRPLPPDWAVLVAHSGVRAEKSGPAQAAYNALRRRGEEALRRLAEAVGTGSSWGALREAMPGSDLRALARRVLDPAAAAVAEHVVSEADRVDTAWQALEDDDIEEFGAAMDASHTSLTDRCRVGHPRLDDLVGTARQAGAAGARLTGAGFGGCVVALARDSRAEEVADALAASNAAAGLDPNQAPVFRARPGSGARVSRRPRSRRSP